MKRNILLCFLVSLTVLFAFIFSACEGDGIYVDTGSGTDTDDGYYDTDTNTNVDSSDTNKGDTDTDTDSDAGDTTDSDTNIGDTTDSDTNGENDNQGGSGDQEGDDNNQEGGNNQGDENEGGTTDPDQDENDNQGGENEGGTTDPDQGGDDNQGGENEGGTTPPDQGGDGDGNGDENGGEEEKPEPIIHTDENGFVYSEENGELYCIGFVRPVDGTKVVYMPSEYQGMSVVGIRANAFTDFGVAFGKSQYKNASYYYTIAIPTSIKVVEAASFDLCWGIRVCLYAEIEKDGKTFTRLLDSSMKDELPIILEWESNLTFFDKSEKSNSQARDSIWGFRPALGWSRYSAVQIPDYYE